MHGDWWDGAVTAAIVVITAACLWLNFRSAWLPSAFCRDYQGKPGSIPGGVTPDVCMWESCRTMPLTGGFSRGSPVSPAFHFFALLHSHRASPSSALKTSMLRAAQISSLTHSLPRYQGWRSHRRAGHGPLGGEGWGVYDVECRRVDTARRPTRAQSRLTNLPLQCCVPCLVVLSVKAGTSTGRAVTAGGWSVYGGSGARSLVCTRALAVMSEQTWCGQLCVDDSGAFPRRCSSLHVDASKRFNEERLLLCRAWTPPCLCIWQSSGWGSTQEYRLYTCNRIGTSVCKMRQEGGEARRHDGGSRSDIGEHIKRAVAIHNCRRPFPAQTDVFTTVASNTYAAITVGHVEAALVRKHNILPLSATAFTRLWFLDDGSQRNGMCATSPSRSRRRRTVDEDMSTPVAVLQCRANAVEEAVRFVTAMVTRWRSSRAVVTLRGPVPARRCVRPVPHTHHCRSSMPCTSRNAPFEIAHLLMWHSLTRLPCPERTWSCWRCASLLRGRRSSGDTRLAKSISDGRSAGCQDPISPRAGGLPLEPLIAGDVWLPLAGSSGAHSMSSRGLPRHARNSSLAPRHASRQLSHAVFRGHVPASQWEPLVRATAFLCVTNDHSQRDEKPDRSVVEAGIPGKGKTQSRVAVSMWAALTFEVFNGDRSEVRCRGISEGMHRWGKRECPEKTHRQRLIKRRGHSSPLASTKYGQYYFGKLWRATQVKLAGLVSSQALEGRVIRVICTSSLRRRPARVHALQIFLRLIQTEIENYTSVAPNVLDGREVWGPPWPRKHVDISKADQRRPCCMRSGIILMENGVDKLNQENFLALSPRRQGSCNHHQWSTAIVGNDTADNGRLALGKVCRSTMKRSVDLGADQDVTRLEFGGRLYPDSAVIRR
ncbi:hypothetical protein PR048_016281 [Dryococelus australis]|uniref:Uncharacterized protein n=1 Tax=Dryococelus australis TaxID=614101 RepID=A0ABQ9HJQ4_9NEOP|nr:hypothetical protein PR048_016281 [Dryococelus australis]